jgi:hypothetical protein
MRVLELGAYDAVLGMDWLDKFSPMTCEWHEKWLEIPKDGKRVKLQGIIPAAKVQLLEVDHKQLDKWINSNEVWALAVLESIPSALTTDSSLAPDLQCILSDFADVFQDPKTLPPHRALDHAITLIKEDQPINSRPYRYSPLHKDEIERQVSEMLQSGVITTSMSPYASPVLLVKKKDDSWRFCVDFRRLNNITVKNKFPLPIVDELLDELAGTKFFSKIDLRAGYHQIRMREEDEHKTAFKTHHGHFQFRVMPFGLTNAPATFQCVMNQVFAPFLRKFVIVFLDDILIYSASWTDHLVHLKTILQTLRDNQFFAKMSKCSFGQTSISYLGHIISDNGVSTDPEKTQVMQQWPVPANITELRGFLGLTGYYRKFVKGYGLITKPLTQLLTKQGFHWTEQAQAAFDTLKHAMVNTPVLSLPDFSVPFTVETDACATGVGAVLMQQGHPVAYLSKSLGIQNSKLSIYEKEFLAVIMAIDRWKTYLQRGPFVILTDHKSLCTLGDQQLGTELQRKAMSKLMGLQFEIRYKKGSDNAAADSLSRVGHLLECQALSICQPDWLLSVLRTYDLDNTAQQLLAQLAIQSPDNRGYSLDSGLIKYKGRIFIGANMALQTQLIDALHNSHVGGHSGVQATYQHLRKLYYWEGMKSDVENYVRQCQVCQQAKPLHTKPAGLLQPLPVPEHPWHHLTMDFIEGLPLSEGYDTILVVVDTSQTYL